MVRYTVYSIDPPMTYAGFWLRVWAVLIDSFILWAALLILAAAYFVLAPDTPAASAFFPFDFVDAAPRTPARSAAEAVGALVYVVLAAVVPWLYFSLFESSSMQATPGKLLFDLRVVDSAGRRLSFGGATLRHVASYLSAISFYVGYLGPLVSIERRTLHDVVAGTLVLRNESSAGLELVLERCPADRARLSGRPPIGPTELG